GRVMPGHAHRCVPWRPGSSPARSSGILGPMRSLLAVGVVLWAGVALARTAGPPPCPGVPFLGDQPRLDPTAGPATSTVDSARVASIAGRCAPVLGRWRRRVDGSVTLRARWLACGAVANVRVRMRYDATCATATGRLNARRHPRVLFTA